MPSPSIPRPASPNAGAQRKKKTEILTTPPPPPPPPFFAAFQKPSQLLPSAGSPPPPPPMSAPSPRVEAPVAMRSWKVARGRAVDSFLVGNYLPLTILSSALFRSDVAITQENCVRFKRSSSDVNGEFLEDGLKRYQVVNGHIDELRAKIPRGQSYEHENSSQHFATLVAIEQEWATYIESSKTRGEPVKNLYRGDTDAIRYSYDWLDDFMRETKDATVKVEHPLRLPVTIAPIMSTAKTDQPMQHGYLKKKSVLWHINAQAGHRGLEIGLYQEEEITFPMRNDLLIEKLVYLPKGLSYKDDPITYGADFKYVIVAQALA